VLPGVVGATKTPRGLTAWRFRFLEQLRSKNTRIRDFEAYRAARKHARPG